MQLLSRLQRASSRIGTRFPSTATPAAFESDCQARLLYSEASLAQADDVGQSRGQYSTSDEEIGSAHAGFHAMDRQPTAAGSLEHDLPQRTSLSHYRQGVEAALAARGSFRDKRRSLVAYNALIEDLSHQRKAFLLRDVLEEMQVDGVAPNWQTWSVALGAASRQRMLPDARFCFQEMQRTGHKPTSTTYATMISVAGRVGQLEYAMKLLEEMQRRGLEVTRRVRIALVSCYSQAGMVGEALGAMEDILDKGWDLEVKVLTDIMRAAKENAVRDLTPTSRGQAAAEIERLLIKATEIFDLEAHADDRDLLLSGAMEAYVELGLHHEVRETFNNLVRPNHSCHNFLIFSNFQEVAAPCNDGAATTAQQLEDFYRGCSRTMDALRRLEAQGVPLRVPYAHQMLLAILKVEEHTGLGGPQAQGETGHSTKPMELAYAVMDHIDRTGQFISEIYGTQLVYRAANLRRREPTRLGHAIFRSMARTGHTPHSGALASLLAATRLHAPEEKRAYQELKQALDTQQKNNGSGSSQTQRHQNPSAMEEGDGALMN